MQIKFKKSNFGKILTQFFVEGRHQFLEGVIQGF